MKIWRYLWCKKSPVSNLVTCHERIGPCCARIIGAGDKGVPKPMMDLLVDGKQRWVIVVQIVGVFGHSYRLDAHRYRCFIDMTRR